MMIRKERLPLIFAVLLMLLACWMLLAHAYAQNPAGQFGTQRAGNPIPLGSTPVSNSTTGTTTAIAATLPADTPGYRITYICGFFVSSIATAATAGNIAVTNILGGTLNFEEYTAAVATIPAVPVNVQFTPCLPATGPQTTIVVTTAAPGSGGVVTVAAWGYQY